MVRIFHLMSSQFRFTSPVSDSVHQSLYKTHAATEMAIFTGLLAAMGSSSTPALFLVVILPCLLFSLLWFLKRTWWDPMRITRMMEAQGIKGPAYTFFRGSTAEASKLLAGALAKPMELSHNVFPRVQPHFSSWFKTYGRNVLIWQGTTPRLVVGEAELVKEILNDRMGVFPKGETPEFFKKLLGDGLAMTKGKKWARHRKLANHSFRVECIKRMIPEVVEEVESMMARWEAMEGKEVDLSKEFTVFASEIISRFAFGSSYAEGNAIFTNIDRLALIVARNSFNVRLPLVRKLLQSPDDIESKRLEEEIRESILKIVKKREMMKEKGDINGYGDDLLGSLLSALHEANDEERITLQDLIDECKTFYFGGHETTATMLSWTFLLLATNPEWQEMARAEVAEIFGDRSLTSDDTAAVAKLKTLAMILNESMRLYPPVLNIMRVTERKTMLGKLVVPKGMELHLSPLIIHHDRSVWGDDAQLFRPERFAEGVATAVAKARGGAAFFPFGGGQRVCVGQGMAMLEARVALAMILRRYAFTISPGYVHPDSSYYNQAAVWDSGSSSEALS
ncbi:hypothetical protein HPP92_006042 [Vanilla planifolia]|uniref:Cytochrome P450 n=1 Tax=Vanilla planifolia TaxID=51239 RepID=A0A835RNX8_VANPL|nr:hypothetical protein HPP92_006042 [Vanilla planifolia]